MNKTAKLVIFMIIASVFNIVVLMVIALSLIVLASRVLNPDSTGAMFIFFSAFLVSVVATFLIYGRLMKWATRRFNLEKHIPQMFRKK
jgi:ABC-type nickel/cobalt efflux system permease component RcnA